MSQKQQFKRAVFGVKFQKLCETLAKQLKVNDPTLSQDEAFRQARQLVKIDWKQTKKAV